MHLLSLLIICVHLTCCPAVELLRRTSGGSHGKASYRTRCRGPDGRFISSGSSSSSVNPVVEGNQASEDPQLESSTSRLAYHVTQSPRGPIFHYVESGEPSNQINLALWFTGSLPQRPGETTQYQNRHAIQVSRLGQVGYTSMFWHYTDRTVDDEQRFHVSIVSDPAVLMLSFLHETGLYIESLSITAIPLRSTRLHRDTDTIPFRPQGIPLGRGHRIQHAQISIGPNGLNSRHDASYVLTRTILAEERLEVNVRVRWVVRWSITTYQPAWWDSFLRIARILRRPPSTHDRPPPSLPRLPPASPPPPPPPPPPHPHNSAQSKSS